MIYFRSHERINFGAYSKTSLLDRQCRVAYIYTDKAPVREPSTVACRGHVRLRRDL